MSIIVLFKKMKRLRRHENMGHSEQIFMCVCGKQFGRKSKLKAHQEKHRDKQGRTLKHRRMATNDKERIQKKDSNTPNEVTGPMFEHMRAKKVADAPKRPCSAFIFFSNYERAKARLEKSKLVVDEIDKELDGRWRLPSSKELSQRWHALDEVSKSRFWQMSLDDKERFRREKALYMHMGGYMQTSAKKDPNASKRPASAFILFSNVERSNVFLKNPNISLIDITKELNRRWSIAPPDVKAKYNDIAKAEMECFRKEPKRNMSTYKLFFKEERVKVRRENRELCINEIGKEVARRWSQVDSQTKARFELMAYNDKQRYLKEKHECHTAAANNN